MNRIRHVIPAPVSRFYSSVLLVLLLLLGGCASAPPAPPANPHNVCAIFAEHKDWLQAAKKTEQKYATPVAVTMAFIYQESQFVGDNQPKRNWYGVRPSTAYGYAQALDTTWADYQRATGQSGADRDDFGDSVDFIGWYNSNASRRAGIASNDAYRLYLAYHEGIQGYQKATYRNKQWLLNTASKVEKRALEYQRQLTRCRDDGDDSWFWKGLLQ